MMKKEKMMTIKIYILVGLLLLSLFVALIYIKKFHQTPNKVTSKVVENKKEPIEEINTEEEIDVNSDIALEFINKINIFDSIKAGSYYGYFYNQDYLDINNISNDAKIMIGIAQNKNFKNDFINATYEAQAPDGTSLNVIILAKDEVEEGINSFFGPSTVYQDENLKDGNGFPNPYIDTKVIRVFKTGKNIEIYLKIAYIKYDANNEDDVIKYVYTNNNANNYLEAHHILTDNSYKIDNILDKLDTFKFTFTLNSNNYYYFNKVEKIK